MSHLSLSLEEMCVSFYVCYCAALLALLYQNSPVDDLYALVRGKQANVCNFIGVYLTKN